MQTGNTAGEGKYAKTPPVTWRNRHRRAPKNKAPITRAEALARARTLEARYRGLEAKQQTYEPTQRNPSEWDEGRFIEGTTHARLRGDLAQAFLELIERISDADPPSQSVARTKARTLSKKGYGSVRAREGKLDAQTPDHVSKWDGDYSMRSAKHYKALGDLCGRFANLIAGIA